MKRAAKTVSQLTNAQTIEYVALYAWAFALVNNSWFVYNWYPTMTTLALWWVGLIPILGVVACIARYTPGPPSYDFYAPTRYGCRTTQLMLSTWGDWHSRPPRAAQALL